MNRKFHEYRNGKTARKANGEVLKKEKPPLFLVSGNKKDNSRVFKFTLDRPHERNSH